MFNKEDIRIIEFTNHYGIVDIEMIALFNTTKCTEQEALEEIEIEQPIKTIIITKKQFENVFRRLE